MNEEVKIVINGVEYHGIEEVPPEFHEQYLRALKSLRELADTGAPLSLTQNVVTTTESFEYNGRTYASRDELPPEVRDLLEQLPVPKPGENETRVEATLTRPLSTEIRIVGEWEDGRDTVELSRSHSKLRSALVLSVLAIGVLFFAHVIIRIGLWLGFWKG